MSALAASGFPDRAGSARPGWGSLANGAVSKLHSKRLRLFQTRTMARQCYASHKRNGRRVSSAASKPSSHALFALLRVRSSRADARFAVSRSPNRGTGPEGRWLLGALGFGQSGLCENLHYKPRSIPAYLKQQC